MSSVTVIVGLPGSGKSVLASRLARERDAALYDDPRAADRVSLTYDLTTERDVVITSPYLCRAEERDDLAAFVRTCASDATIAWIFFENAPDKATANDARRPDGRRCPRFIRELSADYTIPEGATLLPIWTEG